MRIANLKTETHPCGYLSPLIATDETFFSLEVSPEERDRLLSMGFRAFGQFNFRPNCIGCHRCIPLRVPLELFRTNKSQRRVINHCKHVEVSIAPAHYTPEKYELYLDHSLRFGTTPMSEENMIFSFYNSAVPTLEFCYRVEKRLVGVGIVHETPEALSSVYFTYLRNYSELSLGTFSILQEIAHGIRLGKKMLYLGYYIRDNHFMRYKASFLPNEILSNSGEWIPFRDTHGVNDMDPRYVPKTIM